jgi:hypothetical protein
VDLNLDVPGVGWFAVLGGLRSECSAWSGCERNDEGQNGTRYGETGADDSVEAVGN